MAKTSCGGHQEVGAKNSECDEHNLHALQEDSWGPIPDDRQLYKPKIVAYI